MVLVGFGMVVGSFLIKNVVLGSAVALIGLIMTAIAVLRRI